MTHQDSLVDGDQLLTLTAELRAVRTRIDAADVADGQRRRWRSAIARIAEGAPRDLATATQQLRRLSAQLDRAVAD